MDYSLFNVKSNLNPELIYDSYKNGKLDEEIASERLISIIENDKNEDNRIKSVEILGEIGSKQHKISDFLREFLRKELEKIKKKHPQILNHFYDCVNLPQSVDWLIEIYVKCKTILFFKNRYGRNFLDYVIEDEELVKIAIIGLDVKKVSDIIGLGDLTELKYLDLRGNQIEEIDFMENFSKLERLHLEENQIKEIKGLDKLTNLTELYLCNNQIAEIKGLDKLKNLIILDLSENNVSKIIGLISLFNLSYLALQGNNIAEIEGLENLENLHELNLGENQISKIEGLETLNNLRTLYLYKNQIATLEGIEGIESLKDLRSLDLRNNIISEEEIYV